MKELIPQWAYTMLECIALVLIVTIGVIALNIAVNLVVKLFNKIAK